MNALFASNPDSLGRRAWDGLGLDQERPGRPDAVAPTARDSAFGRRQGRENQPKIIQLVDGRVHAGADALAKRLVRRFADQYRFTSVCLGRPDDAPPLDETDLAMLMLGALSDELAAPPAPLELLPLEESAEEIRAQQAEALWQSLLYDTRG